MSNILDKLTFTFIFGIELSIIQQAKIRKGDLMTTHKIPTGDRAFESIKSGNKTIEVRLYYPERHNIKPGDFIEFSCDGPKIKTDKVIKTRVLGLIVADTLEKLGGIINIQNTEIPNVEQWLSYLREFYSDADITKYGIAAIYIALV